MTSARDRYLSVAENSGILVRYLTALERGEQNVRRLWLCQEVEKTLRPGILEERQRKLVNAALRRFITGGLYAVVTRTCQYPQAAGIGDIRELKVRGPIFVEVRFKPPKHHLRIFGRFIGKDDLVLTSIGEKSQDKQLSIPTENKQCTGFFSAQNFSLQWVPKTIQESISNAKFA
jgi:hypothetical protein